MNRYLSSIPFFSIKLPKLFDHIGHVTFVVDEHSTILIDQFCRHSTIIAKHGDTQQERFDSIHPKTFFGKINKSFSLFDNIYFLLHIGNPSREDNIFLGNRFEIYFIRATTHHD